MENYIIEFNHESDSLRTISLREEREQKINISDVMFVYHQASNRIFRSGAGLCFGLVKYFFE